MDIVRPVAVFIPSIGKCSDVGEPAPYGGRVAPMTVYRRRGRLIGESQERVARAEPLPGDVRVPPHNKDPPSPGQEFVS